MQKQVYAMYFKDNMVGINITEPLLLHAAVQGSGRDTIKTCHDSVKAA